jgi:hypothetical protein
MSFVPIKVLIISINRKHTSLQTPPSLPCRNDLVILVLHYPPSDSYLPYQGVVVDVAGYGMLIIDLRVDVDSVTYLGDNLPLESELVIRPLPSLTILSSSKNKVWRTIGYVRVALKPGS